MAPVTTDFLRERADAAPVTLRHLLATPILAENAALLAGHAGIDAAVTDVAAGSMTGSIDLPSTGAQVLAVVDGRQLRADTYQIDVAIRNTHEKAGAGLILCTDRTNIVLAAIRLANKLKVPLIVVENANPIVLTDDLRRIVSAPQLVRSNTLLSVIDTISRASSRQTLSQTLSLLSETLNADLALISAERTLVAGNALVHDEGATLREVVTATITNDGTTLAQPMNLARNESASFWLLARMENPTESRLAVTKDALLLSSWFIATRLVADRLERERDARFRMGVLSSIISGQERFETVLKEHLALLEWRVDGWCAAIHWQASGDVDPLRILSLTDQLGHALRVTGMNGALVERPDGWTSWIVSEQEPSAATFAELTAAVQKTVTSFLGLAPGLRLHVGIGRPYLGLAGLRMSLSESKEAGTIAQASGGLHGVQHIDAMGIRRILLGWYTSDSFAEFAHTLLTPLLEVDADGSLLHTLEIYLDQESSATMAAQILGVHRNTILNRIDRLKTVLTVDLDNAEERLAVQLACRVVKMKRDDSLRGTTSTHQVKDAGPD